MIKDDYWIDGNVPSQKNSKEIVRIKKDGRERILLVSSKNVQYYRKTRAIFLRNDRYSFLESARDKGRPLFVGFYFVRDSKRIFDYHNAVHVIADMMVEEGWIVDDCMNEMVPVFLGYCVDKSKPGVYIRPLNMKYANALKDYNDYYGSKHK